jgi:hypothetical protein
MQLLAAGPGVLGPGLPKLHLSLQGDPQCQQQLADWLFVEDLTMPSDALAMVVGWPAFKDRLCRKVRDLNKKAKARRANQEPAARRQAAWDALQAARQHLAQCQDAAQMPAAVAALQEHSAVMASLLTQEEEVMRQRRRQQWVHKIR